MQAEPAGRDGERSYALAETEGEDGNTTINSRGLLEEILSPRNMNLAYKRVERNGGSSGVDGMKVDELLPYLKQNGKALLEELLLGKYKPQPVKRVEIPKPEGGIRLLGIPTVTDRMIQQAISQVLTPIFEEVFSNHSYGFRPGRSTHQALKQAKKYMDEGYKVVVDIDLEKFFDRVNHDKLMYLLSRRIKDKRVLKLVRLYLESGVMESGLVSATDEGTPQGGPLSPLLSNVMLHELDMELERRGHRFCRYADDCNIYVRSMKAGDRVMKSISLYIEGHLKLKVNTAKSAVDIPSKRRFLGMSFYRNKEGFGLRVHPKSIKRFRDKVRRITAVANAMSMEKRIEKLNSLIQGWVSYFRIADMRNQCRDLDGWIRRRLRLCIWSQWKKIKTRHDNLVRLGISDGKAWEYANTRKGAWRISKSPVLNVSLANEYLNGMGFRSLSRVYSGF